VVTPEQATIDACKLEHLVSNATARQLQAFLRFVDADQQRGRAMLDAWRAFSAGCNRAPTRCPTCDDECLAARPDQHAPKRTTP
jgi:Mn-dependent DtxR family transcriptional regulator